MKTTVQGRAGFLAGLVALWAGCGIGTISEEELEADYRVMPDKPLDQFVGGMVAELKDELGTTDIQIKELTVLSNYAVVEAAYPGHHNRIYSFRYDGFWLSELDLKDDEPDKSTLFAAKDIPIAELSALHQKAHDTLGHDPGSFCQLTIRQNDAGQMDISISIRKNIKSCDSVVFDAAGQKR
jgi:hypothetical protein